MHNELELELDFEDYDAYLDMLVMLLVVFFVYVA